MSVIVNLEQCPCRWRRHEDHDDWWHRCILRLADATTHEHVCECGASLSKHELLGV